jgi:hypothetical protein
MRLSASVAISAGPADSDFVGAAGTWDKQQGEVHIATYGEHATAANVDPQDL